MSAEVACSWAYLLFQTISRSWPSKMATPSLMASSAWVSRLWADWAWPLVDSSTWVASDSWLVWRWFSAAMAWNRASMLPTPTSLPSDTTTKPRIRSDGRWARAARANSATPVSASTLSGASSISSETGRPA